MNEFTVENTVDNEDGSRTLYGTTEQGASVMVTVIGATVGMVVCATCHTLIRDGRCPECDGAQ